VHYYIVAMIAMLAMYISFKILIKDRRFYKLEPVHIVLSVLLIGLLFRLLYSNYRVISSLIIYLLGPLLLVLLGQRKGYSFKKAMFLSTTTTIIWVAAELVMWIIWSLKADDSFESPEPLGVIAYTVTVFISSILFTTLVTKFTVNVRNSIKQAFDTQKIVALIMPIVLVLLNIIMIIYVLVINETALNVFTFISIALFLFASFGLVAVFGFVLYVKRLDDYHQYQREEEERKSLLYYMDVIEKQYTDIRKFKHDYQNLLLSLKDFIEEGDLEGLTTYFNDKIKPLSEKIINQNFALENMTRLKVRELKSILSSKLIMAQENGISIQLDIKEDITDIPMNSVNLVRMLGIILDNAIEALVQLPVDRDRTLIVGIWRDEKNMTILIQNTCCDNIPKLHKLRQSGFSTKGKDRGLGLSNLLEIAAEQANVWLDTSIEISPSTSENSQFIQKIIIEFDDKL